MTTDVGSGVAFPYTQTSPSYNDYSANVDPVNHTANIDMHVYGHDEAACLNGIPIPGPFVPNIDVKVNVNIQQLAKNTYLVSGNTRGDDFPADETYMTDKSGQKLFLSTSGPGAGKDAGPATLLWGLIMIGTWEYLILLSSLVMMVLLSRLLQMGKCTL